jgi:hypothetical protein
MKLDSPLDAWWWGVTVCEEGLVAPRGVVVEEEGEVQRTASARRRSSRGQPPALSRRHSRQRLRDRGRGAGWGGSVSDGSRGVTQRGVDLSRDIERRRRCRRCEVGASKQAAAIARGREKREREALAWSRARSKLHEPHRARREGRPDSPQALPPRSISASLPPLAFCRLVGWSAGPRRAESEGE